MIEDPKRATGRTTGMILQALGKAIENPGTEVKFIDHYASNYAQVNLCKEKIEDIAKQLNLDVILYMHSFQCCWGVVIKSNWIPPYVQGTPAEEKWKELYGEYPDRESDRVLFTYFKKGFEAQK